METRMFIWLCVVTFLRSYSYSAKMNAGCITPTGEIAKCVSINACTAIKQSIASLNLDAIEFARKSQCGYENGPLVCCGSSAGSTTTAIPLLSNYNNEAFTQEKNISDAPLDDHLLPDNSLCGIQIKQGDNRIVGGNVTNIHDFPWMVALKYAKDDGSDEQFRCGGTLISEYFVLTAAQCLKIRGYRLIAARLGEWRISTNIDCIQDTEFETVCSGPVIDLNIVTQIPHPYYSLESGNNDIALVKLEKKIAFNDFIRPICLPPPEFPEPKHGTYVEISGWGITEEGKPSDYKLKAEIPIVSNEKCKEVFRNYTHINPNQACAGGEEGKDACYGDSGGPLMTTFKKKDPSDEEQWYQEGIIYRGIGCGRRNVPSLYTRISRYTKWILNAIHFSS